ncbi:MAG: hypothetical protein AAFQ21_09940 [Pseudomonadota bacterium]
MAKPTETDDKAARLSAALRANLKRRKAAQRKTETDKPETKDKPKP